MKKYDNLKNMFDEKINKEDIYKKVTNKKILSFKFVYPFIFASIIIVVIFNINNNKSNNYFSITNGTNNLETTNIYFNIINNYDSLKIKGNYNNNRNNMLINELDNLILPDDFDNSYTSYEINNNYIYRYKSNDRLITITYNTNNKGIRDYLFVSDSDLISKINNIELKIYEYKNRYIVLFKYNDKYFDIETNGITDVELLNILSSIIKG